MKIINITASRHAVFYSPLLALINGDFLTNEVYTILISLISELKHNYVDSF